MKPSRPCRIIAATIGIVTATFISGCVSPQNNYRPLITEISTPAIGKISTAYVGDELVKQGKFFERDAIKISQPLKVGLLGAYTLMPGFYAKTGEDRESEFYLPDSGPDAGMIQKGMLSDPPKSVQLHKNENRICVITVFNVATCAESRGVTRTRRLVLSEDSFQQTLIYSGKVGNKINIGYREFSNSHARPAFNNDVEYDLNESKVIGYKGAKIEVIEANNQFIKYKVMQNFNAAKQ